MDGIVQNCEYFLDPLKFLKAFLPVNHPSHGTHYAPFLKLSSAETAEQLSKNTIFLASNNKVIFFVNPITLLCVEQNA